MKKRIGIEALLSWAYRDELPKAFDRPVGQAPRLKSGWGAVASYAQLLTVIDYNSYGVLPDPFARLREGEPHADALVVAKAVDGLDALDLDIPADWYPLEDMGDLGPEGADACMRALKRLTVTSAEGVRHLRVTPRRLVISRAIAGSPPEWQAEKPERVVVRKSGNHPAWFRTVSIETDHGREDVEVEGFDYSKRRPFPGAYTKVKLVPDPVDAAVARAEYEVWHAALGVLAEDLGGTLTEHEVCASLEAACPWTSGALPARTLLDLSIRGAA